MHTFKVWLNEVHAVSIGGGTLDPNLSFPSGMYKKDWQHRYHRNHNFKEHPHPHDDNIHREKNPDHIHDWDTEYSERNSWDQDELKNQILKFVKAHRELHINRKK